MAKNNSILDKILPPFPGTRKEMLEAVIEKLSHDHWPAIQAQRDACTICPRFGQQCSKNAFESISKGGSGCMIHKVR